MKQAFIIIAVMLISLCAIAQNDSIENQLREVVVTATKPLTKFDGDGTITTITGTPLQSLQTAGDVLGYIPGVVNSNGAIEVVGQGQPLIYINGRKLTNYSELEQIPAAKVKDVKLINNPGSRYDSSVNAVIRISTVKEIGDGFSLDSRSVVGYRDYWYGKELFNMNYRVGGLDVFGFAEYNNSKSKGSTITAQNLYGTHSQHSTIAMDAWKRSQMLQGKIGFNYVTNSRQSFGAFYQNTYKPEKTDIVGNSTTAWDDGEPTKSDELRHNRDRYYEQLVDAYYFGNWGRWTVDASFNYLWRKATNNQQIGETAVSQYRTMNLDDRSHGRMFAGELNLSHPLNNGSVTIGAAYTNTTRQDVFFSDETSIRSNHNQVKEDNIGVYGQLAQTFGHVTVQAGLRYEHIGSDYYEFGNKMTEQSGAYDELLPSLSLVVPVYRTMFQLSYTRKYNRPLYSQLSSTIHYVNQYTCETGNPNLKTSFVDNVTLNFRYSWLMVMATYKRISDKIITECTEYQGNPDIVLYQKRNSKRDINNFELILSAMPGFIGHCYYPVIMAGVVAQVYDIDYLSGVKHMNSPMAIVRMNNMFSFSNNYMLNINLNYRSGFDGENIHMSQTWQFDLSASKTINHHWDIKLSMNDIFNTARKTRATVYSGMRDVNIIRYNTLRGIELTIGYKFNTAKSKYHGKGAGNTEKERL